METLFKLSVTALVAWFVYYQIAFVWKLWHSHVDPVATFSRIIEQLKPDTPMVATREPNRLYQGGNVVGQVEGDVIVKKDIVVFAQLSETSDLNEDQPIEYQRLTLKIRNVRVRKFSVVTSKGLRNSVWEDVTCDIVR